MKRKKVSTDSKPAWGIVPMEQLVSQIQFWETIQTARLLMQTSPAAAAEFKKQEALQTPEEVALVERLDQITPQARQSVEAWVKTGSFPVIWIPAEDQPLSAPMAVLKLWEINKAARAIVPDRAEEFLSLLPQEARLLLRRLEKHLIRSAANNPQTTIQNDL